MRIRFLVGAKLLEMVSRGAFILFCTYSLPIVDAGKFGLISTVVGLASFLLGFERVIDVQRRVAGNAPAVIHQQLRDTLHFFGVQYVIALPILALLLGLAIGWPIQMLALFTMIVIGEHLSNQAYLVTLVDREAFSFILAVIVKNITLFAAVLAVSWNNPTNFDVFWVMHAWGLVSLAFVAVAFFLWKYRSRLIQSQQAELPPRQPILDQYRASRLHFLMGLVAIIALQADRFVVGATLSAEDIGVYFRNITLAALAFQFFNIVSFNRVAPDVYHLSREGRLDQAFKLVKTESGRFAVVFACLVGLALTINTLLHNPASRFHIETSFVMILTATILLRTTADYLGLLLLSVGADTRLLRHQTTSVVAGVSCMTLLAALFHLPGAFLGTLAAPAVLLGLNLMLIKKRFCLAGNSAHKS